MPYPSLPKDPGQIPISSLYVPGTGFTALQGVTPTTDGLGNQSAPLSAALYGKVTNPGDTPLLLDSSGRVLISLAQVAGNAIATAATGIMKVGVTDGSGAAITSTASALDVNIKSGGAGSSTLTTSDGLTPGSINETAMGVYSAGGQLLSTGLPSQASVDRLMSWLGKNNETVTITSSTAGDSQLTCGAGILHHVAPGQKVKLSGSGSGSEWVTVTTGYTPSGTATSVPIQGSVQFSGQTSATFDTFGGPGTSAVLPTGLLMQVPVLLDTASGNLYAAQGKTGVPNSNLTLISGQAPQLDTTNRLGVSLYGKNAAAGDTPVLLDASGRVIVNINTMPAITGTVTANVGTTNGLALDASVTGLQVAQGSTTSGQKGNLIQGAVTTSAPSYTTAQTSPLSLTPAGALRTDSSATTQPVSGTFWQATQPVSGTVTANAGTGNFNNAAIGATESAIPTSAILLGASDGTNLEELLLESNANPNLRVGVYNAANELAIDAGGRTTSVVQAVAGTALAADQTNSELRVSNYGKSTTAGDVAIAVNASGDTRVAGDFTEQTGLSAGSLNADLVASTDVSGYAWLSLHITAMATGGTITFQASNDNFATQIENVNLARVSSSTTNAATTTNTGIYEGPVNFRYFRARQTAWTSGSTTGVLELFTVPRVLNNMPTSQAGTWTVQPGNTANTTSWLVKNNDGTNAQNVLAATSVSNALSSQGAALIAGADQEVTFTTTSAQAVASTDATNYRWVSVQVTSQGTSSTVTFQGCNDNATWVSVGLSNSANGANSVGTSTTTTGVFHGPLPTRYFRLNVTGISAGTTAGTIEFQTMPSALQTMAVQATQSGTWTTQPGNTQNTTPWLVSQGPPADLTLLASGAQTTTQTLADQTNFAGKGVRVVLDMTTVGTGSVTLEIDAKDVASGKYVALLTGAAVTSNSTNVYVVYPGLAVVANAVVSDVLPHTWRVKVTANNANSATYSVGASYLT